MDLFSYLLGKKSGGTPTPPSPVLPSEYTMVNYIQSSGTQYIDTGYKPNINTKINLRYSHGTITGAQVTGAVLGCRDGAAVNRYMLASREAIYTFYYGDVEPDNPFVTTNIQTNNFLDFTIENSKAVANGVEYTNFAINNFPNLNIYLFSINTNGEVSALANNCRIGRFKIYENNILIHDFAPCYRNSDSIVGMYDLIGREFYTNAGTGSFTYGNLYN